MSSESATKCLIYVLNAIYLTLGLGLAVASIWLFIEVKEFTNLRNSNHYLLDYNLYWPQVIPWVFFIVGMCAVFVSCCGFSGVKKSNKGMLTIFSIFLGVVVLLLVTAAVIALVFADSQETDKFIKDTIWDAYFQSKTDNGVAASFGTIEKRLHCCGAEGPRDYKNWKNEFPTSCCDTYYGHGWGIGSYSIDCDFTNKLANERHGCSAVATQYARIAIKVLSAVAIFTGLIGIISLIVSVTFSKNLSKRPPRVPPSEADSKKVLL